MYRYIPAIAMDNIPGVQHNPSGHNVFCIYVLRRYCFLSNAVIDGISAHIYRRE